MVAHNPKATRELADELPMPQKPERTIKPSAYRQIDPPEYYHTIFHPPNVSYYIPTPQFKDVPEPRIPFLPTDIGIRAPTTTQDDRTVNKTWHDEWEVEPRQFGSRRPLTLLNQPADINLKTHPHDAKRVYLNHWDRQHEPAGTAVQRLVLQKQQAETGKRILAPKPEGLEEKRRKVRQAAQSAGIIDLTRDGVSKRDASWKHGLVEDWQPTNDWSHP